MQQRCGLQRHVFRLALGRDYALPSGHPVNGLAIQIAFTPPLTLPLVLALQFCVLPGSMQR